MPFERVSLTDITERIVSDFQTRITGATSLLRNSVLRVMARVYAGAVHLLYGYLQYQAKQLFVATADTVGLDRHGSEYSIYRTAASRATGSCEATGTNGVEVPAGTELRSNAGQVYTVDLDAEVAGGTVDLDITAQIAGYDGNDSGSIILRFVSPIVGISSTATVTADGITGGADQETDAAFRQRILTRKRYPPHGGAEADYEAWAKEVSGVTRAWSIPQYHGPGTIGLAFVRDNEDDLIPTEAQMAEVEDYIIAHTDPNTGKTVGIPATAEPGFFIIPLYKYDVDFEISIYPNNSTVRAAVEAALDALILRDGGPEQTIYLSRVSEAISLVSSEERHSLVSPVSSVTVAANQVHVLGTVTFNDY